MKTCRKWVAALFAIILTVSSCVVMAEEALPTQWDLTEIYENVDAWQADYDRAMEILPQYESYQGTLNTAQGIYDYLQFAYMGELTRLETRLYLYAYLGYTLNPADSTFSAAGEDNRPAERGSALCGGFAVGTLFLAAGNAPGVLCRSIA